MTEFLKVETCEDCPAQPYLDTAEQVYLDMPHSRYVYDLLMPSGELLTILKTIDTPRDEPREDRLQKVAMALSAEMDAGCEGGCAVLHALVSRAVRADANEYIQ